MNQNQYRTILLIVALDFILNVSIFYYFNFLLIHKLLFNGMKHTGEILDFNFKTSHFILMNLYICKCVIIIADLVLGA